MFFFLKFETETSARQVEPETFSCAYNTLILVETKLKKLILVLLKDFTYRGIYIRKIFLFPENSNESQREDLLSELKVMKELLSHKHVVELLACVTKTGEKASLYHWNNFNRCGPR